MEHLVQLRHLFELVAIKLAGLGEVTSVQWLTLQAVELKKLVELVVAAVSQLPLLQVGDVVHLQRANKRDLDAEASVDTRTIEANKNAVVDRDPLGVCFAAFKTVMVRRIAAVERIKFVVKQPLFRGALVTDDELERAAFLWTFVQTGCTFLLFHARR
jgi:hypothetical protein